MTKDQLSDLAPDFFSGLSKEQKQLLADGDKKAFRASLNEKQAEWNSAALKAKAKFCQSGGPVTYHYPL